MSIKLNILTENRAKKMGILGEHGLSILVEVDGYKVLFDTGQTNVFVHNASNLGIDISQIDALVLSHGHYDHTGGVPEFCKINKKAPIYIHPDAFVERYNAINGKPFGNCIGIPWNNYYKGVFDDRIIFTKEKRSIHDKIFLSGEIPDNKDLPRAKTDFIKVSSWGEIVEDKVMDEQFMAVKANKGLYIIVGCSHPGVLNCIAYAKEMFPGEDILGIIGGLHMEKYNEDKQINIFEAIKAEGVGKIIPMHCTGVLSSCFLKSRFNDNCILLNSGDVLNIEMKLKV